MGRDTAIAVGLGCLAALGMVSLLTGSFGAVILAYLAPLPLFLAGLMLGTRQAVLAAAIGALGALLLGPWPLVSYLASMALPTLVLTRQALLFRQAPDGSVEWYPPGLLATWLTGLAAAGFLAAVLFTLGSEGGLPGLLRPRIEYALSGLAPPPGAEFDKVAFADGLSHVMPPLIAVTWMLVTAANGILAQGLASRFGRNLRPAPRLGALRLPMPLAYALLVASVGWLVLPGYAGFVAEGLAVILAVPFFLQGLGLIHVLAGRTGAKGLLLAGFYLLLFLSGILALPVLALGLVEQWADLRRKLSGPGQGKEDE
ncbi:MAG: DUF2232 domain-containing protein [Alphaproteobacteria bacterium]|nr:DUF2232 domain-containing protein [Alphaproteobacteria bacterium]